MHKRLFGLLATAAIAFAACQGATATPVPSAASAAPSAAASPSAAATAAASPSAAASAAASPSAAASAAASPSAAASAAASPSGSAAAGDEPDLTTTTYAPTPAGRTGGTIVLAEWQFPDTFIVYYAQAVTSVEAAATMFNGLLNLTHDLKYVPDLASNIPTVGNGDVVVRPDGGMDVTWRLKDGMKWSDGEAINCDDVIGTWEWIMDEGQTGLAGGTTGWEDITGIDGAGTTTCVVHFDKLYSGYLALMSPILPEHYITTVPAADAVTNLYQFGNPTAGVYSGPYIPTEVRTDAQITLAPNPNWETISGHAPYLDGVIWKYYGDAAAMVAGYRAGEVDVAVNLNDADLPSLSDLPQEEVHQLTGLQYELHAFNNKRFQEKFGEDYKTIIRAVMQATDREAIAAGPLAGTVRPTNNFVSSLTWYYHELDVPTEADPEAAAAALDAIGWTVGADGIREKNGTKLALDYCTTTRQVRVDTLALVASQLKQIGVQANVSPVPALPDFFGGWNEVTADTKCNLVRGNYDVGEFAYLSPLDPLGGFNVYHSTGIPDPEPHQGQNVTRISLPELDAAYEAVRGNVDFAIVRDAMRQVQEIYGSDQNTYELPLYNRTDVNLVSPKVQNFTGNPSNATAFWNIGDWWLEE
jgi:peptide/nickel transport system substrate-binding protein